jgi:hypothetical protein
VAATGYCLTGLPVSTFSMRFRHAILLPAAACALFGCTPSPTPEAAPALVGAWRSKVQFLDGPFAAVKDLEFLYAFNQGGTMTESSNYDGAPPVPPAYGTWRETSPNTFEAKYVFFNSKPPAKFEDITGGGGWSPGGYGELQEKITLNADGKSFDSEIKLEMFDQSGKPATSGGKATGHGSRIGIVP